MARNIRHALDPTMELLYEYRLEAAIAGAGLVAAGLWGSCITSAVSSLQLQLTTMLATGGGSVVTAPAI